MALVDASKPPWAELEFTDPQKQKHDRGYQGNCQHRRQSSSRKFLVKAERLEQSPFLVLQGEDGHEGDRQSPKAKRNSAPRPLLTASIDDLLRRSRTAFGLPMLQLLVGLFDNNIAASTIAPMAMAIPPRTYVPSNLWPALE